jgi:hypothetical protein
MCSRLSCLIKYKFQCLTELEWEILSELNARVNGQLHSELDLDEEGKFVAQFIDSQVKVTNYADILVKLRFVENPKQLNFKVAGEESP